jgi:hypothetical protein
LAGDLLEEDIHIAERLSKNIDTIAVNLLDNNSFNVCGERDAIKKFTDFFDQFLNNVKTISQDIDFDELGSSN